MLSVAVVNLGEKCIIMSAQNLVAGGCDADQNVGAHRENGAEQHPEVQNVAVEDIVASTVRSLQMNNEFVIK